MKRKLVGNDAAPARVFQQITLNVGGNRHRLRHAELEGRDHLVVPTVMMTEGVHVGNSGAGYYPAAELEKVVKDWNHMPAVVYHPEDGKSARSPNVINTRKVGVVLNSRWKGKQKAEVWLDVERTNQIDDRIVKKLEAGEKIEVSTGLYLNMEKKKDKWGAEEYEWVARDHRPDHLAILPDKVGACSIKDGAGMLQFNEAREPGGTWTALRRGLENALKTVGVTVTANEMSFSEIAVTLNDLLAARYGEKGKYWRGYVCAVYDEYVVFSNSYDDRKTYRVAYTKADGVVKLSGEATEVVASVEYKPTGEKLAANEAPRRKKKKAREPVLNHSEDRMDKDTLIAELVANGGFEEADRDWLKAKTVDQLKKLRPKAAEVKKETETPAPAQNAAKDQPAPQMTMDQMLAVMPAEFKAVFNQGQKALAKTRESYVGVIKNAGDANKFSDAQLAAMDLDTLAAMAELARGAAKPTENESEFRDGWRPDYTLATGPANNQKGGDDEPLTLNAVQFADPRQKRVG